MRLLSSLLLCIFCLFVSYVPIGGRVPLHSKNGMVVSSSLIASEIGRDILKEGGNAIDAAVATAFALAVTWPSAGNIGGGGFIVYVDKNGAATTFDFREKAPFAAHEKMFLDASGNLIKGSNHVGVLSVGTPGTVAGLYLAHQKYGKLPWKKLLTPAIKLASKGIPYSHALTQHAASSEATWKKFPSTAAVMYKNGKDFYALNENWKQPELAETLKRIRSKGRDGFYKGETAEKLVKFIQSQGGIMTLEDLEKYDAIERKPITGTFRDYTLYTMGPPSSGGVALVEMLNILEGYNLKAMGYHSADYIHVLKEAMKRGFADRAQYLGDPDFNNDIPVEKLTSKEYAKKLRESIQMDLASVSDSSRFGQLPEAGTNTTHLSVVDKDGAAVSLTYTLEQSYGSQVVAEGLGFFLNDEMGDFNPVPGVTDSKGQIGTKANLIQPGKRMLSSMTPTILTKNNKPVMVIGSPGGRTIINTVLQVILNVVEHNMNIAQAVEAPRFHHQWLPDRINFEPFAFSAETLNALKARGHQLQEGAIRQSQGSAMGIFCDHEKNLLQGAADSRSPDGGAAGY
ncbi:MAG TPA: gamma-glutamyltransferase [Chryseosolibacter sp.]